MRLGGWVRVQFCLYSCTCSKNNFTYTYLSWTTTFMRVPIYVYVISFQLKELYVLLSENYVEDDDCLFRFDYPPEFLKWYAISFFIFYACVSETSRLLISSKFRHSPSSRGLQCQKSKVKLMYFLAQGFETTRMEAWVALRCSCNEEQKVGWIYFSDPSNNRGPWQVSLWSNFVFSWSGNNLFSHISKFK